MSSAIPCLAIRRWLWGCRPTGSRLPWPIPSKPWRKVEVQGRVVDQNGIFVGDYSGQVWLQVFDSAAQTRADGLLYQQTGAVLVRGVWPVAGGRFSALFRLPKDISYRGGAGRASAYVWSVGRPDGAGAVAGIVLSGTATDISVDASGPQIHLGFFGHDNFSDGDFVGAAPRLRALLEDASGFNMTGETGHGVQMTLDGEVFFVTDSLAVRSGDYRKGEVTVQLPKLSPGQHRISLKVWDVFNNSSAAAAAFMVGEGRGLKLEEVLFYPNPMDAAGHFSFVLSAAADRVDIRVFSLAGNPVDRLAASNLAVGYNQVEWQPSQTLAAGTYIYRVEAYGPTGGWVVDTQVLQVQR